ncbi:hypothetical protein I8752_08550 [Nostocaceae cyanobacterium CENA369]|uniref:Uncharacterized protein n=1 Tax=Dendronalium phyllosphericum CENA369 TaxID=1725256 RepID=A0A8J7I2V0_9NOST|nr:hypothetical protein [Dendronalium phyllosphericum]MBH8573063.1 hypothetical protein [Dendronalium phyllosphericum CENA369]
MIRIVFWNVILGFLAVLIAILVSGTIQTWAANPNLNGDSHPTRFKLNECIADVKEVTAWNDKQTLDAARKICESRQSHAKQKARFLASLKKLQEQYQNFTNHGFDNPNVPVLYSQGQTHICVKQLGLGENDF